MDPELCDRDIVDATMDVQHHQGPCQLCWFGQDRRLDQVHGAPRIQEGLDWPAVKLYRGCERLGWGLLCAGHSQWARAYRRCLSIWFIPVLSLRSGFMPAFSNSVANPQLQRAKHRHTKTRDGWKSAVYFKRLGKVLGEVIVAWSADISGVLDCWSF